MTALAGLPGLRAFRSPSFRMVCAAIFLAGSLGGFAINAAGAFGNYSGQADFHTLMQATERFWAGRPTYLVPPAGAPDRFLTGPSAQPYPPSTFLLLRPWVALPDGPRRATWLLLGLAAVGGLIAAVYAGIGRPTRTEGMVGVALVLLFLPVRETIFEGQFGAILALLAVAAALAWERGRDGLAGALLALAIAIKLTPALLLAYLVWRRRWRTVAWTLGWLAGVLLLTLALGWLPRWLDYVRLMGPIGRGTAFVGNQSLPGVILRLLRPDLSGQPIPPPPPAITLLSGAAEVAVVAGLALALRRGWRADLAAAGTDRLRRWTELGLVLLVLPLLQPFAWFHHWAGAAVLILVAGRLARVGRLRPGPAAGLAAAYLLSLATYPTYRLVRSVTGPELAADPLAMALSLVFFLAVAVAAVAGAAALGDLAGGGDRPGRRRESPA